MHVDCCHFVKHIHWGMQLSERGTLLGKSTSQATIAFAATKLSREAQRSKQKLHTTRKETQIN